MRKLLLGALGLGALAALGILFVVWRQQVALDQPLQVESERMLEVRPGDTPGGLLRRMQADGVLQGSFWLRLHWRLHLAERTLHSGEYRMLPDMTARQLLQDWLDGKVVQYAMTIVEGWNFRQLRIALTAQDRLEQTLDGLSDAQVMERLGRQGEHPEGRFFPDTYLYTRGTSDLELLRRAMVRLDQVLEEEWAARQAQPAADRLPYKTPYQALVMASIIEKETGVPEERGEIAGVFVRRLEKGMLLQTDPTVIYGMGEAYQGRITREDLRRPTPYNTYTTAGLPPTPIAMAGREAIRAALNPVEGTSLYFVARGDGSHVFNDTLEAHNRAVRQYQLKRRADYRSSPPPGAAPVPVDREKMP